MTGVLKISQKNYSTQDQLTGTHQFPLFGKEEKGQKYCYVNSTANPELA